MGRLSQDILQAIVRGDYAIGAHSMLRLRQRGIMAWQVVGATLDGELLLEDPLADPNPKIEMRVLLPDGVQAKAVWSWLAPDNAAKLVTVHFFDRPKP